MDLQSHAAPSPSLRTSRNHPSLHMQECIQECLKAYQTSLETLQYCIQHGGEIHTDPHLLKTLQAAVEICHTSARFMMLQSPFHRMTCEVCVHVCRDVVKSCLDVQDDVLLRCADTANRCAESCQQMAHS